MYILGELFLDTLEIERKFKQLKYTLDWKPVVNQAVCFCSDITTY